MAVTILPNATHYSEFAGGFNGTCTETALAICMGIAVGKPSTQADMVALTHDMIAKSLASANGATTVKNVAIAARERGFTIDTEWDYGQMGDWHAKLKDLAGHKPILLQIANGQALTDTETGAHDEVGLQYHAIAIVGYQDNGYVCADGDNPQVASRYQIYSYATLAAAKPSGLLILNMKTTTPPLVTQPATAALPSGAVLAGHDVTWNGFTVTGDFLAWCQANDWKLGKPLTDRFEIGDHAFQTFDYGELRHSPTDGTFEANIGADVVKYRAILARVRAVVA